MVCSGMTSFPPADDDRGPVGNPDEQNGECRAGAVPGEVGKELPGPLTSLISAELSHSGSTRPGSQPGTDHAVGGGDKQGGGDDQQQDGGDAQQDGNVKAVQPACCQPGCGRGSHDAGGGPDNEVGDPPFLRQAVERSPFRHLHARRRGWQRW